MASMGLFTRRSRTAGSAQLEHGPGWNLTCEQLGVVHIRVAARGTVSAFFSSGEDGSINRVVAMLVGKAAGGMTAARQVLCALPFYYPYNTSGYRTIVDIAVYS